MAMRKSIVGRNAELDALAPLYNTGYIRIYSGAQPATPETAASGVLLAELRFGATAFGASSGGVITANAITSGVAGASGTAGYFRCLKSDGTTALHDGTVGTSGTEMIVPTTTISSGVTVSCSSLTITNPM
jgi:hypothetical protein